MRADTNQVYARYGFYSTMGSVTASKSALEPVICQLTAGPLVRCQVPEFMRRRYQRSTMARWPLRKLLNGRPLDLLAQVNVLSGSGVKSNGVR